MEEIIDKNGEWGGFTVFTGHSLFDTPSGGTILFVLRFTDLSTNPTTSGGTPRAFASRHDIFLSVKKDIEERHAKGLRSRPLDSGFLYGGMRGDVLTPYEFALVHFTRFRLVRWRAVSFSFLRLRQKQTLPLCNTLRGCKHCFRRTLAYCALTGVRQHRRKKYPWGAPTAVKKLKLKE